MITSKPRSAKPSRDKGAATGIARLLSESVTLREFAEWARTNVASRIEATQVVKTPWKSTSLDIARRNLHAAELILALPPADRRYALAPAVALESIIDSAMMFGMAGGEILGDDARQKKEFQKRFSSSGGFGKTVNNQEAAAKEAAKKEAERLWDDGRVIGPLIPSCAAFDRHVAEKYRDVIAGPDTVKSWRLKSWRKNR